MNCIISVIVFDSLFILPINFKGCVIFHLLFKNYVYSSLFKDLVLSLFQYVVSIFELTFKIRLIKGTSPILSNRSKNSLNFKIQASKFRNQNQQENCKIVEISHMFLNVINII